MRRLALAFLLVAATSADAAPEPELRAVQVKAQAGDADAQFAMAEAYRAGRDGVQADPETAIMWYRRAANQGNIRASEELGFALFAHGDRREAMPLIEKAAARGEARAFYLLGTAHFNGDYATRDWPLAYAQTMRAASAGLSAAQKNLTLMDHYLLPSDHAKADQILATLPVVRNTMRPERPALAAPPPPPVAPAGALLVSTTKAAKPPLKPVKPIAPSAIAETGVGLPKTAPASVPDGRWKVQLGAFGSADRARDRWTTLAARVSRLARYDRRIVAAGSVQRLQAGGLADNTDARALCKDVRSAGAECMVIAP